MLEGIFQPTHLLVIFFIALIVFGPKRLPELGKGIGAGIRALKQGVKDPPSEEPKCSNVNRVLMMACDYPAWLPFGATKATT